MSIIFYVAIKIGCVITTGFFVNSARDVLAQ